MCSLNTFNLPGSTLDVVRSHPHAQDETTACYSQFLAQYSDSGREMRGDMSWYRRMAWFFYPRILVLSMGGFQGLCSLVLGVGVLMKVTANPPPLTPRSSRYNDPATFLAHVVSMTRGADTPLPFPVLVAAQVDSHWQAHGI